MQSIRGLSNNNSNSECDCYLGTSRRVQRCPLKKKNVKLYKRQTNFAIKKDRGQNKHANLWLGNGSPCQLSRSGSYRRMKKKQKKPIQRSKLDDTLRNIHCVEQRGVIQNITWSDSLFKNLYICPSRMSNAVKLLESHTRQVICGQKRDNKRDTCPLTTPQLIKL